MRVRGGSPLIGVAAMLLTACASTSVASTPASSTDPPATTEAPTTTTVAPVSTEPPTTVASTEAPTTTTTTVPAPSPSTPPVNIVPVAPVDPPLVAVGKGNGDDTARAQWRLLELGFWLREPNGSYDLTTQQAVMAFQKYYGIETDGSLGPETAALLTSATERSHGKSDAGTLVEIDKGSQLLFLVVDGVTQWILNTSTGSEIAYDEPDKNTPGERQVGDSVTRNGLHKVYRERPEGWWEGDLGEIYRPKYFSGGEAVHGSNHIPDYAASHGCVRVSVPAMDWIWEANMMPMGIPVWVHGEIQRA